VLRWVGLGAIVLVGLLYARPLQSYFDAKHDLARRTADVRTLRAEKRELQHRLAESSTGEALTEQARRLGLVRPGENPSSRASPRGSTWATTAHGGR
jgi:cell division protein FtsB